MRRNATQVIKDWEDSMLKMQHQAFLAKCSILEMKDKSMLGLSIPDFMRGLRPVEELVGLIMDECLRNMPPAKVTKAQLSLKLQAPMMFSAPEIIDNPEVPK